MRTVKSKIIDNYSLEKNVKCYCNICKQDINHLIVKSIKEEWNEIDDDYNIYGSSDYEIIKCVGCDTYSFREFKFFSEFMDQGDDGTYEVLYPASEKNYRIKHEFEDLPYNLETIYKEAIICFNNNQFILCATGIRSILDGICVDRKIKKGIVERENKDGTFSKINSTGLDGKINGMMENGITTKMQTQALHELRFMGNKAVHELEVPTRNDLKIAFDIVEHIIIDIYDLPYKSRKLENKRLKKG